MKLKEWGAFALLGLVWGSSFLWIKVGVGNNGEAFLGFPIPAGAITFGPFLLVAFRLLFGALGLLVIFAFQRQALPTERKIWLAYLFMGFFNTALPFVLITWGETKIDSSLASILNGTVPLFTIVIAHFWLHDEKITLPRIAGLVVGFIGVVVLVSRDFSPQGLVGNIWGQVAVIAASVSYATAITFSRKYLRGQPPVLQSLLVLCLADVFLWIATPLAESPLQLPTVPIVWFAVIWLGLLGSCLAYLLFFYLINAWGPTRASLVTYVFPVIGLLLGILLLGEEADWRLFVGAGLVVAGIVVVNAKTFLQFMPKSKTAVSTQ